MKKGLIGDGLGGSLYKKRIARDGAGKSGGYRSILVFVADSKAFFIYAFAKNKRANIADNELKALKKYAKNLLRLTDKEIKQALMKEALFEVEYDE